MYTGGAKMGHSFINNSFKL